MSNTIITANLLQKEVIKNLDKKAKIFKIANQNYTGTLTEQWNTVTVQNLPSFNMDLGQTSGEVITAEDWAITSENLVINEVFNKNLKIKDIEAIQSNLELRSQLWWRLAESMARTYDQYVAKLAQDNVYSWNQITLATPSTETTATITTTLDSMTQYLEEQNIEVSEGWVSCFINPALKALINSSDLFKSFDAWLNPRLNWFIWQYAWMNIIMTNNLPYRLKYTLPTIPTASDSFTLTIKWTAIVWTYVASWAASAAWDISIWANVAAAQANTVLAITWTATWSATTYIDVTAAKRKLMRNAQMKISAFSSTIAYITSAYYFWITEAITPSDWVFWTPARTIFACDSNAINFVTQMDWYKITDSNDWFFSNILTENVFWWKVFGTNARRIVTKDVTNGASVVDINTQ